MGISGVKVAAKKLKSLEFEARKEAFQSKMASC
jgi:hypothetical protein